MSAGILMKSRFEFFGARAGFARARATKRTALRSTPRENKQAPPSSADPDSSNREQLEISAYSFFLGVPP
jgi:hypothetical protein